MFKRKPSRSREFRKNDKPADVDKLRQERIEKRQAQRDQQALDLQRKEETKAARSEARLRRLKRSTIYVIIFLIFGIFFIRTVWNIVSVKIEYANVSTKNEQLKEQKDRLEEQLANVESDEYVEQQARDILKMIKPGETMYILPKMEDDITKKDLAKSQNE